MQGPLVLRLCLQASLHVPLYETQRSLGHQSVCNTGTLKLMQMPHSRLKGLAGYIYMFTKQLSVSNLVCTHAKSLQLH